MSNFRAFVFITMLASPLSAAALNSDCLRFMVVGICVWVTCYGYGCDVETSIKYGHFNPDLLVAVQNPQGVNRAEDSYRPDTHNRNHQNLIYRETLAIGHPLAGQIYCPSQAEAGNPYFSSVLDSLGWRWGVPDMLFPPAYIPGLKEIGSWPLNTWGPVYPRGGWTIQTEDPKTAAIVAQRTGDIVTRTGQPHVYQSLSGPVIDGQKFTWPPAISLTENTNRGGDWQLMPSKSQDESTSQSNSSQSVQNALPTCEVFGENDTLTLTGWGGGKVAKDGEYLFTLWRPYTCCEIKGATLAFYIDFMPYPPPSKSP